MQELQHQKHPQDCAGGTIYFQGSNPRHCRRGNMADRTKIRKTVRRAPKWQNTPNRLTGLLYCADCGSKLTHRYNLVRGKWVEDVFICSGYRQLTRDCTMPYPHSENRSRYPCRYPARELVCSEQRKRIYRACPGSVRPPAGADR